jgi:uncharacterized OsmC-like protein
MEQMEIQKIEFTVQSESKSSSKSEIRVRDFKVIVDEPEQLGGTDHAPNPVEYILCGLTGCVHILAYKVAKELNFELQDLKIKVSGDLNPEKLFGMSTDERAGYQNIKVKLNPISNASEDLLKKWQEVMAERSPVLDNLLNTTPVSITIE